MSPEFLKQQWDRVLAIVAGVVGVLALLLGWIGVSGSSLVTQQLPYLASGAVVGLVLFGVATTLWLSADLRDEWAKLDQIYSMLSRQHEEGSDGRAATRENPVVASNGVEEKEPAVRAPGRRSSKSRRATGVPTS